MKDGTKIKKLEELLVSNIKQPKKITNICLQLNSSNIDVSNIFDIDFIQESLTEILNKTLSPKTNGVVYVVALPSKPVVYKIGHTKINIQSRIDSLFSAGTINKLIPVHEQKTLFPTILESRIHSRLNPYRVIASDKKTEFFNTDFNTIVKVFEEETIKIKLLEKIITPS